MKQQTETPVHNKFEIKDNEVLKSAHVFENQDPKLQSQSMLEPAVILTDIKSIEINDDPPVESPSLKFKERIVSKKPRRKWLAFLFIAIIIASCAELGFFISAMVEQFDWLAGIWLGIFSVLGVWIVRQVFVEYRGLKQLEKQDELRTQSEQMAQSSVIGLAEQHCLKIAKLLPENQQILVANWRDGFDSHHSDNEVLALFEHQVLAPIDKLALKHVRQNSSAAGVMIAISPFALLDMLIVLWRNLRMMKQISQLYGLHLGYLGSVKLIRKIFHTMLFAGAAEILSDAGNYAIGAGLAGKLSTRVAQGMGAGVLTARIGLKAINESRPLPWLAQPRPNLSGISQQLLADLTKQLS